MTRRGIIIAGFVGLAFAVVGAIFLPLTVKATFENTIVGLAVEILGGVAGGIAGRNILGTRKVHRYYTVALPLLSTISGLAFTSAASYWLISQQVSFGPVPKGLTSQVVTALIIGGIAYLVAAIVYGFAGKSQGVGVGARVGLLLLLLLAVLPILNVAGSIGFVVTAFTRKTDVVTPARPAASE
jgi:hypothetical protein